MALLGEFTASKPKIPKFVPVNPDTVQQQTIAGNTAVLPQATALASQVDTFNQAELDKMYAAVLPGYQGIKERIGANIADQVAGVIPKAVMDNIARASAGQSVYGGFGGSGRQLNLTGGAFANETYNRMQTGMESAQRWLATASAPRFDVTSMFFSPVTRLQHAVGERDAQFQRDLAKNINDANYSFGSRLARFDQTVVDLASAYLGGAGQNTGGGQPAAPSVSMNSSYAPQNFASSYNPGSGWSAPPVGGQPGVTSGAGSGSADLGVSGAMGGGFGGFGF